MTEPSLSELAGHNLDAQQRLTDLLARYRREGLAGLRAAVLDRIGVVIDQHRAAPADPSGPDIGLAVAEAGDDLIEAVLTLAEVTGHRTSGRRAWEDFERAESERESRGGL